jgi:hypothetical protein
MRLYIYIYIYSINIQMGIFHWRNRETKMTKFLADPECDNKLTVMTLMLKVCMLTMGYLFRLGKAGGKQYSLFHLMGNSIKGPLDDTIAYLFQHMEDLTLDFWTPLTRGETFTETQLQHISNVGTRLIGNISARMITILQQWPWRGAAISNTNAPMPVRVSRLGELKRIKQMERWCCVDDEFTKELAVDMGENDALLDASQADMLVALGKEYKQS